MEFEDAYDAYDFSYNSGWGLKDFINSYDKNIAKFVCEFMEISKAKKSVLYGDSMEASSPDYHLYPYDECLFHSQLFKIAKKRG